MKGHVHISAQREWYTGIVLQFFQILSNVDSYGVSLFFRAENHGHKLVQTKKVYLKRFFYTQVNFIRRVKSEFFF